MWQRCEGGVKERCDGAAAYCIRRILGLDWVTTSGRVGEALYAASVRGQRRRLDDNTRTGISKR
jgi:hypothetical protein